MLTNSLFTAYHEARTHDQHLERPPHDADVLPSRTVERDQIIHVRGQGVDDDTRGRERHDAVPESPPSEASLDLLYDLIVAYVDVEVVIELGHDLLDSLVT